MRRPGPDDIEDTEADHHAIGHAVLAVQGEGHESARGERNEEGSPGPATIQDTISTPEQDALDALAQPHTALAHRILGPLEHAP